MNGLVYLEPRKLEYGRCDRPIATGDDLLVRVEAVGICGSDLHAYLGHDERRPAPLILGHEAAGTVVGGARDGERVTINPLVSCGACAWCTAGREHLCPERQILSMPPRQGAFAEYVVIPSSNVVTVPDAVDLQTACLVEPLAVGWHAVSLAMAASRKQADQCACLVQGGGAIGMATVAALLAHGYSTIEVSETHSGRRQRAQRSFPTISVSDPTGLDIRGGSCYDVVIDCVGLDASRAAASKVVHPGGVMVHVGLGAGSGGLDIRRMTLQEITLVGSYTYTPRDFRATASALFEGRLGSMDWFETRPLSEGSEAFADLVHQRVDTPKIVLLP